MKKAKSNFLITKIEFKKKEIILHYLKDEEEKEFLFFLRFIVIFSYMKEKNFLKQN